MGWVKVKVRVCDRCNPNIDEGPVYLIGDRRRWWSRPAVALRPELCARCFRSFLDWYSAEGAPLPEGYTPEDVAAALTRTTLPPLPSTRRARDYEGIVVLMGDCLLPVVQPNLLEG